MVYVFNRVQTDMSVPFLESDNHSSIQNIIIVRFQDTEMIYKLQFLKQIKKNNMMA